MVDSMPHIVLAPMSPQDVPQVHAIERRCFSAPWEIEAYYGEARNPSAVYLVARAGERILGFGGMWVVESEAHIVTLATHPSHRRQGIGHLLLQGLLEKARQRGIDLITLEVRVSNVPALALYAEFGFRAIARRKGYYPDNGEDAAVMALRLDGE